MSWHRHGGSSPSARPPATPSHSPPAASASRPTMATAPGSAAAAARRRVSSVPTTEASRRGTEGADADAPLAPNSRHQRESRSTKPEPRRSPSAATSCSPTALSRQASPDSVTRRLELGASLRTHRRRSTGHGVDVGQRETLPIAVGLSGSDVSTDFGATWQRGSTTESLDTVDCGRARLACWASGANTAACPSSSSHTDRRVVRSGRRDRATCAIVVRTSTPAPARTIIPCAATANAAASDACTPAETSSAAPAPA